jgi:hypothetical protein
MNKNAIALLLGEQDPGDDTRNRSEASRGEVVLRCTATLALAMMLYLESPPRVLLGDYDGDAHHRCLILYRSLRVPLLWGGVKRIP